MVLVHACSAPGAASQCFAYVIPVAPATVIATARARGRAVSESGRWGSNPRPSAWEADALPTELRPRVADSSAWDNPLQTKGVQMTDLAATARALVAEGKGILAADESTSTIKKRFDSIGLESTEENRRGYRELLFTTPGVEDYISGVILYDETIRQSASDGTPFPKLLASKGVIPGIKVDEGAKPLAHAQGET